MIKWIAVAALALLAIPNLVWADALKEKGLQLEKLQWEFNYLVQRQQVVQNQAKDLKREISNIKIRAAKETREKKEAEAKAIEEAKEKKEVEVKAEAGEKKEVKEVIEKK